MIKLFLSRLTASLNKFKNISRSTKITSTQQVKFKDWYPIKLTKHKQKEAGKYVPLKGEKKNQPIENDSE